MASIVVFRVWETYFGIDASQVKAIIKNIVIRMDNGAVEYEGQKIGVVELLGKREENGRGTDCLVISRKNGACVIPVDDVLDIFHVVEKDIVHIPSFAVKAMSKNLFKGVFPLNNMLILLLDAGKL